MKKVLMTAKHLDYGGIEKFINEIYPLIDRKRYRIDFVITKKNELSDPPGIYEENLIKQGAKVYRISPKSRYPIKSYKGLKKIFEENKDYDIFHINDGGGAAFPLFIAKQSGIKNIVIHSHNSNTNILEQHIALNLTRRIIVKSAKCIACSRDAGNWMFGKHFELLYNGIDCDKYKYNEENRKNIRNNLHIENELVIGHVGRLVKQKNHIFLIRVFKEILDIKPASKLILIGSGEEQERIISVINENNIDNSVILIPGTKDIYKYLSAMDVFIFPSLYEGFSIAYTEAQCNGLLCTISDNLPKDNIITDRNLRLSLNNSPKYWADTIVNEYQKTADGREKYADYLKINGYDISSVAERLMEIYDSL